MQPIDKAHLPGESKLRHRDFLRWAVLGAVATIVGLSVGPRMNSSQNPWISVVFAFALYGFSLLLCDFDLSRIRGMPASFMVLTFSIPLGVAGLLVALTMKVLGPSYLSVPDRDMVGLAFAVGSIYAAAVGWAIVTGRGQRPIQSRN